MASLHALIEDLIPLGLDAQEARKLRALLTATCPPQQVALQYILIALIFKTRDSRDRTLVLKDGKQSGLFMMRT